MFEDCFHGFLIKKEQMWWKLTKRTSDIGLIQTLIKVSRTDNGTSSLNLVKLIYNVIPCTC